MMKCLYFLLIVATSQAFVIKDVDDNQRSIPRPEFKDLTLFNTPVFGCTLEWNPVTNTNSNPVIGYRVIVLEDVRPNTSQIKNFQDIELYGADNTIAAVAKLVRGLWYEFRVQAITNNGYGPLSNRWGFMVHPRSSGEMKNSYTLVDLDEGHKIE